MIQKFLQPKDVGILIPSRFKTSSNPALFEKSIIDRNTIDLAKLDTIYAYMFISVFLVRIVIIL